MAKNQRLASATKGLQIELVDDDGMVSMYADVFIVAGQAETGMVSIAFYQSEISIERMDVDGKVPIQGTSRGRLVSRIILAPTGAGILLGALRDHVIAETKDTATKDTDS